MATHYLIADEPQAALATEELTRRGHRVSYEATADGVILTLDGLPSVEAEEILIAAAPAAERLVG